MSSNFRIVATVEKVTGSGNKYQHIVYVGEFSPLGHDELHAREFARKRIAELNPTLSNYNLVTQPVPEDYFAYN